MTERALYIEKTPSRVILKTLLSPVISIKGEVMKRDSEKCLKEKLAKKHVCYVLITCDAPSDDGNMQVNMSYEGDAALAAYLLQGAQVFIDEQQEMGVELPLCQSKIDYLNDL